MLRSDNGYIGLNHEHQYRILTRVGFHELVVWYNGSEDQTSEAKGSYEKCIYRVNDIENDIDPDSVF